MRPWDCYQQDLNTSRFIRDPAQARVVETMQGLYDELLRPAVKPSLLARWKGRKTRPVKGLYLYGGVGRGKTYLMDLFYECLPFPEKQRSHFHRFMREVHEALGQLPKTPDPLPIVARRLASHVRVLCLDEFHVNDIADAMLMAGLLRALFEQGVTLIATSNTAPVDLYRGGLQRDRFLPAIDLIEEFTQVQVLSGQTDYRQRALGEAHAWQVGAADDLSTWMEERFKALSPVAPRWGIALHVNNRPMSALAEADDVVWFRFAELCETARASADYLDIAQQYHTVLISDVPVMKAAQDAAAKRFIHLIDALYDHRVKLLASARAPISETYQGEELVFAFTRTISRIQEMDSRAYWSLPHKV